MYNCFESEVQRKVDCILSEPQKHWGNRQISQIIKDFLEYLRPAFYLITHCGTLHTKSLEYLSNIFDCKKYWNLWLSGEEKNPLRITFLKFPQSLSCTHTHLPVSCLCVCRRQLKRIILLFPSFSSPSRPSLPPYFSQSLSALLIYSFSG